MKEILKALTVFLVAATPLFAHAALQNPGVELACYLIGLSRAENGVDIFYCQNGSVSGTTASCGILYIAPEDKQLYATLLSANSLKRKVSIQYNDSSTSYTFPAFGNATSSCKLISITLGVGTY